MNTFGERIRQFRKAAGITQGELAQKLNVHLQTVSKWERGISEPDIAWLGELCAALGVSLERLAGVPEDAELVTAAVYVNGEKLDESYVKEPMLYTGDQDFEVPEGCYFMLGDNRNNSEDARYWNDPYIPEDRMLAKVYFRYWPGIKWLDD